LIKIIAVYLQSATHPCTPLNLSAMKCQLQELGLSSRSRKPTLNHHRSHQSKLHFTWTIFEIVAAHYGLLSLAIALEKSRKQLQKFHEYDAPFYASK